MPRVDRSRYSSRHGAKLPRTCMAIRRLNNRMRICSIQIGARATKENGSKSMFPFVLGKDFSPEQTVLRNTDHWRPKRRHSTYTILVSRKKLESGRNCMIKGKFGMKLEEILGKWNILL